MHIKISGNEPSKSPQLAIAHLPLSGRICYSLSSSLYSPIAPLPMEVGQTRNSFKRAKLKAKANQNKTPRAPWGGETARERETANALLSSRSACLWRNDNNYKATWWQINGVNGYWMRGGARSSWTQEVMLKHSGPIEKVHKRSLTNLNCGHNSNMDYSDFFGFQQNLTTIAFIKSVFVTYGQSNVFYGSGS